jgi:hypothetical protein
MLNNLHQRIILAILIPMPLSAVNAQFINAPITKVGGFIYLNKHDNPAGRAYSFNLEREMAFGQSGALTHGPRMDYQSYTNYSTPQARLAIGYQLKFYPLHRRNTRPFGGVFAGVDAFYYVKVDNRSMYGPGVGALVGYQYLFKKKFSLAFEAGSVYFQNVNENVSPYLRTNELDRYFDFFLNIKIGIRKSAKDRT